MIFLIKQVYYVSVHNKMAVIVYSLKLAYEILSDCVMIKAGNRRNTALLPISSIRVGLCAMNE